MSKAYDRVEWDFSEVVLKVFGFPQILISIIVDCVMSVSYLVLINGLPSQPFRPGEGLRQGDPLSVYLFILCVEILSRMLVRAYNSMLVSGIKVAPFALVINNLFFGG